MTTLKLDLNILNKTTHDIPSKPKIKSAILDVLVQKKYDLNLAIDLKIVTKAEIQKLNQKYRAKDMPTDVLSFPIYEIAPKKSNDTVLLGDIVICFDVLKENAEKFDVSHEAEFLKLVTHSTLHLLGYHHKGD